MKKRIIGITMAIIMGTGLCACGKKEADTDNQKPKATATVSPTATVKPTESPKPTQTVTEQAVEVTNEAVTEEPQPQTNNENNSESSGNITELNKIMYAKQDINIRKGPSSSYGKIGSLTVNQQVVVTGQDNNSGWYRINLNGVEGYVSNKYLSENETANNNVSANNNTYSENNNEANNTNDNHTTAYSDNGNGGSINNTPPINEEQNNPTVIVEQPPQQPQPEQIQLPDIEQAKNDIIATLRAKGCVTHEEYVISNYGQEFWNESLAEWGQAAYSGGLGWFEARISTDNYWGDIYSLAANYSNNGQYWIKYLRTEGKYLIFKCYVG